MANDQNNVIDSVQSVYAGALLELAEEHNALDAISDEVRQLGETLDQSPDLARLLDSKVLSEQDRGAVIDRVFKGRVSDLLLRFLHVLNRKTRLGILPGLAPAFRQALQHRRGQIEVEAHVAQPLDAAQQADVTARLSKTLGGRQVILRQIVNPDLLGGLKLRVGDEIVDGSVVAQLKIMREKMVDAGRAKAAALVALESTAK